MAQFVKKIFGRSKDEDDQESDRRPTSLTKSPGKGYLRVPSRGTISNSTTNTSLVNEIEPHQHEPFTAQYPVISYLEEEDEEDDEEEDDNYGEENHLQKVFHFQKQKSISIGSAKKLKMEMENWTSKKGENLKNAVPFVKQLSTDRIKEKDEYSINGDTSPYQATTHQISFKTQFLATIAVSLGSLIVGFTTAYTAPALNSMQKENGTIIIGKNEESWISGLMPLTALIGSIIGGSLITHIGRRNTLLATVIPFIISYIVIATATSVYSIYVGRAIGGLCVGIGSLTFPVYLGEVLQPEVRGRLGLFPTAFGNIGILISYVVGKYLNWSWLAYFGAFLPIPFMIFMCFIPETPRWFISKAKEEKAKKALIWLRGKNANVENELHEIVKAQVEANKIASSAGILNLFKPENRRAVMILMGLMCFQQFSGINAIIFYTVEIFKSTGSSIDENLSSIIVGIVNFMSTFVAAVLIDRLGRKFLLYVSGVAMVMALASMGTFYYVLSLNYETKNLQWVPLASCVIYVVAFSFGFGPVPWLMMGEILPSKIKGTAASLATSVNWTCTFIVTKTFHDIISAIGMHGTMWLFGVITIVGLVFTKLFVPETRGKSLEDIEKKLSGKSEDRN